MLDNISLALGTEVDLVEVEGGGETNLVATASYGGIKVRTLPGTVHCK